MLSKSDFATRLLSMLSYQHIYHAGNHADVLKHILLGDILTGMQHKPAPVFVLDAFAGRGVYDLQSPEAQKTKEYITGIQNFWNTKMQNMPHGVQQWMETITQHNPNSELRYYPGSTALLKSWLREHDRLAACDLHPQEFQSLRTQVPGRSRQCALHHRDAYDALASLLPPKEKRGLVFLDPSFEDKSEYRRVAQAIIDVYPKFRGGVYAIWYPLLPAGRHKDMFRAFQHSPIRNVLRIELSGAFENLQMQGSGLLIINSPWHAMNAMQASLDWLAANWPQQRITIEKDWLIPE